MYPSEIRARVLEGHRVRRGHLDRIGLLAEEAGRSGRGFPAIREALDELMATLRDHIALEDAILAPALGETDAFGDVRCQRLVAHHEAQFRAIARSLDLLADAQAVPDTIAEFVRERMRDVRADMDEEERTLLDPGVLRDDTVTISPTA